MSTKDLANVRLNLGAMRGMVEVNGQSLTNAVTAVAVTADVKDVPVVSLTLLTHDVTVDGEARVTIPDETHAALTALGWTPPPTDEAKRARDVAALLVANPIYVELAQQADERGLECRAVQIELDDQYLFQRDGVKVRVTFDLLPAEAEALKTPAEWAAEYPLRVTDPDGWRQHDELGPKSWDEPITREEFSARMAVSTCGPVAATPNEATS